MPHANLRLNEPVGDEVKTTTCYMCACRCGIKVHLKDGRVRYIQGNRDELDDLLTWTLTDKGRHKARQLG